MCHKFILVQIDSDKFTDDSNGLGTVFQTIIGSPARTNQGNGKKTFLSNTSGSRRDLRGSAVYSLRNAAALFHKVFFNKLLVMSLKIIDDKLDTMMIRA